MPPGQTIDAHGSPHADVPGPASAGIVGLWHPARSAPIANVADRNARLIRV